MEPKIIVKVGIDDFAQKIYYSQDHPNKDPNINDAIAAVGAGLKAIDITELVAEASVSTRG